MQISSVALVWTQNTGAPISRSQGAAADPGDHREEDECDQCLPLLGGEQGAGDGEHRNAEVIEQLEREWYGDSCRSFHFIPPVRPERKRTSAEVEGRLAQPSRQRPSTSLRTNEFGFGAGKV